ncbi:hypothetical protein [Rouxiella sp. Mn2063]|uniref:hypothetical protein n=1 Tax=Rouxiella sp. Mn2063 TaxID=3395262 RepID=UPI003BD8C7FC
MSAISTFERLSVKNENISSFINMNNKSEHFILINEQYYPNEIAIRLSLQKLGYQLQDVISVDKVDNLLQDNCDYVDLIIIGISRKEPSLIDKLQQIFNLTKKGKRVLVHCQSGERMFWGLLVSLGIKGVILDSESEEEFAKLIFNLVQGNVAYSTEVHKLIGSQSYKMLSPVEGHLILDLLSGKRVTDIARVNGRDVRTASAQKISVMKHLNIHDDGELYALGGMMTCHLGQ